MLVELFRVLLCFSLFVQEPALSGRVTDETGLPLPGVSVTIRNQKLETKTDEQGNYLFQCLGDNTYDLVFELEGFLRKTIEGIVYHYPETITVDERLKLRPDIGTAIGTGLFVAVHVLAATDGAPVTNADVTLSGMTNFRETRTTDNCGRTYWIITPGNYQLELRKTGFESTSIKISPSNKHVRLQLKLTPK